MSDELKKQTEILAEMLKWIKVGSIKEVKRVLEENLNSDTKKLIYNYSDGIRGTQDFKEVANVKRIATISDCWKEWKRLGILKGVAVKGGERGKKIFNLEDFGIPIPEVKQQKKEENKGIEEASQEVNSGENQVDEEIKEESFEDGQEFREGNPEEI